ncbi:hypothetical protein ASPVEDRAFT_144792 [Aspergillus versicolor CBS 583.65]|uniref:DNA-directed RNA polymerase subunit n=1 Tax=Aspergillus versicolor CBS 583.65 TaxID=1036611 RepID=A0A1L9Q4I5_ASPVE|nr:uncharacterized protein ASPVEDRAFT_144792 [Aspergillus versicolor CBS 583.65]OJJ08680.1 hypothetical protein ASPVEDRAFT_144792 [Aspergillus versicolor CBS 583.65]
MAVDTMEIDSSPILAGVTETEKERKRKNKHKDEASSPSKKKRKQEKAEKADKKSKKDKSSKKSRDKTPAAASIPDSPYSLTTATLYLPLSPISISPTHALASLLAEHLSPLLLTYYPPLEGIVLAYSNASISSEPPSSSSPSSSTSLNPQPLTLAASAGEYGVMYVYLTATFLVFRPQRGQTLEGWVNVQSEGFLGAVVLNLFSVGIERKRLPRTWKWIPPGEEDYAEDSGPTSNNTSAQTSEDEDDEKTSNSPPFDPAKEHFNPVPTASDSNPFASDTPDQDQDAIDAGTAERGGEGSDEDTYEGYFQSISGHRVRGTVKFRVVDIDVIPGSERDRGFLSIEGTMLSEDEEAKVVEDERNGVLPASSTPAVRKMTVPVSSGGIIVPQMEDVILETPSKKSKKAKK